MPKNTQSAGPTPKTVVQAFATLLYAFTLYPVMIGLFFWVYIKGYHWIFGAAIIASLLILDPFWRLLLSRLRNRQ